ncbi:hypothetical protein ACJ41O_015195 [Fusarium nematophilum]
MWDQSFESDDHILFGSHQGIVDVSILHPEPIHIFRLWQIYLDNVNPLLKVTHTPSLQGRIIEAASNVQNISPALEALMFGIYCMATLSLSRDMCQDTFHESKEQLLTRYQFGCQKALSNSRFLRTNDRDCLTALYLYLHSSRSSSHIRAMSSLLGVAMRIAQRMGIQTESTNARHSVLEAEMRRRLWWSLVLFDARISALSDHKPTMLAPTWDCAVPLNVCDSDLREEMRELPVASGKVSEAVFAVLGGELGDFIRHQDFFLDLTNPVLKAITKTPPQGGNLAAFIKTVEDKTLKFCDPENPLHFTTLWMTRASLSNFCLMEGYANVSGHQTDEYRDDALSNALRWLECDTQLAASSVVERFSWFFDLYFPFPAYIRIAHDLKARPLGSKAQYAWDTMSDNYEARSGPAKSAHSPSVIPFADVILQAWDALEAALKQSGEQASPPRIVSAVKLKRAEMVSKLQGSVTQQTNGADGGCTSTPVTVGSQSLAYGQAGPPSSSDVYFDMYGQDALATGLNQLDWVSMDWALVNKWIGEPGLLVTSD